MDKTVSWIASLIILTSLFVSTYQIRPVKAWWEGTIYIRADGSIDPPAAPIYTSDNVTYTVNADISSSKAIIVERDNIIIDGNRCTLWGPQEDGPPFHNIGVELTERCNVTVERTRIEGFTYGICLNSSENDVIVDNELFTCMWSCIYFLNSSYNFVSRNKIWSEDYYACDWGIFFGYDPNTWMYEPCNNNTIADNVLKMGLESSLGGIYLKGQNENNTIINNYVEDDETCIKLFKNDHNYILNNTLVGNEYVGGEIRVGVMAWSNDDLILGNNIIGELTGVWLTYSCDNFIYHNNFINDTSQLYSYQSVNIWDDSYPPGGNYWSSYNGTDFFNGPFQNLTGNDGIRDMPYVIDSNNTDHYPLMQPWTGKIPTWTCITISANLVPAGSSVTCNATVAGNNATGTVLWSTSSNTSNFDPSNSSLSFGNCSTTYADTSPEAVTITASYSGDPNNLPSSCSVTLTVFAEATNSTNLAGGNGAVNQTATTGISLNIIGSSAPDGTNVTVTSANYGTTQPSGTGALQVGGTAFYDVQVNSSDPLGSTAVALVYITNPNFTAQNRMFYWDVSTNSWMPVATQFIAPDTLCGAFFVSDLTGTQIMVKTMQNGGGCGRMPYMD